MGSIASFNFSGFVSLHAKILHIMNNLKIDEVENCLDISALTGKNLTNLKQLLQERFYGKIK